MNGARRIAIVGAGVAGLVAAKTLSAQGLDCVVFERGERLGGVWADGYSNFGVQVWKELYEFPDWPMPRGAPDFAPGPVFQQYLEDYVDHFDFRACLRFKASVTGLEARGDGWTVTIDDNGEAQREDFDFVIIATGLYSNVPNMPSYPGEDEFPGAILHNSQVKTRAPLAGRNVVVVGYGKSAADIAIEATEVANDVHLVFRETHWPVPRKVAGVLPFKWGALNRMASAFMPLYQRPSRLERWLHGIGKPLVWLFWRIFEVIIRLQYRLDARIANGRNLLPAAPFETDTCGEGSMVAHPRFFPLIHNGRISAHRTEIDRYTNDGVVLQDGTHVTADCVVLATGWKNDFSYLPDNTRAALGMDNDGFYLYRHILHPALPNLAFVGRATAVCNILTHSLQARWLAELIAGRFGLPERADMLREIDEIKAWKRSWMHYSPARSTRLFMHAQHYHDELMKDIGADPLRKRGFFAPLKELLAPYEPTDYREIVAGNRERRDHGASHL
ncbi:MAG: flavin-containing monooxygenase [Gammaproteobacteria bacterium]|jgi:dimethylaniline monooxygenase (N-oxide forming)